MTDHASQPSRYFPRRWIPYLVLMVTLVLTLIVTYQISAEAQAKDQLRFQNLVQQTQDEILSRLETHIALLRAGSGLFAAEEEVSEEMFHAFVERLELQRRYPGIQGIGFSQRVPLERRSATEVAIWPEGERPVYYPIVYIEPVDRRNEAALGYDMFSEPTRQEAMVRARDTGLPAASGRVTLVQEIDTRKQAGFLIYVPVYRGGDIPPTVEERQEAIQGFVYSPFRADDLLRRIFGNERRPRVEFQIYDGPVKSPDTLLHDSNPEPQDSAYMPRFVTTTSIEVAGRLWTLEFATRPAFELTSGRNVAPFIGMGGILVSLLFFWLTRSQVQARTVAEQVAAELRHSEQALRRSERRFRRLVESNLFGVAFGDFEGRFLYVNDAFLEMVGYSREELIAAGPEGGIRWTNLTPPEYRHLDENAARELRAHGVAAPFEKEYIRKDGTRVPILIGRAMLNEPGEQQNQIAIFYLDLTERKRAEAALHLLAEAGARLAASLDYQTTLDSLVALLVPQLADYCLIIMVEEGGIRQAASAHVDAQKATQLATLEHLYETELHDSQSVVMRVLRSGQPEFYKDTSDSPAEAMVKDPRVLAIQQALEPRSLMFLPLVARQRTFGVMVLAMADSGRRYGTVEFEQAEEVARRAALALDNARLYQEAQAAVLTRDHFLSIASHDLKTPITSLKGYADLLLRRANRGGEISERNRRALEIISEEATRLNRLVELLLDVSRIQSGRLTLEKEPFDLSALTQRLVGIIRPSLNGHSLSLDAPEQLFVEGDELRLEQVLQNLIGNAIKYSPEGGPITVTLAPQGERLLLSISDEGMGIPAEALPQLFSRFFRADNVISYGISGQGLGLYIVRYIVEAHGGSIQVTSEEGVGTTFTITLPLKPSSEQNPP